MSDHYNGFIVTLEHDLKAEDAEATIAAIRQLRGVISVRPEVANPGNFMVGEQIRHSIRMKLLEVLMER